LAAEHHDEILDEVAVWIAMPVSRPAKDTKHTIGVYFEPGLLAYLPSNGSRRRLPGFDSPRWKAPRSIIGSAMNKDAAGLIANYCGNTRQHQQIAADDIS
jgi:hypothetical protein